MIDCFVHNAGSVWVFVCLTPSLQARHNTLCRVGTDGIHQAIVQSFSTSTEWHCQIIAGLQTRGRVLGLSG